MRSWRGRFFPSARLRRELSAVFQPVKGRVRFEPSSFLPQLQGRHRPAESVIV